MADSSRAISWLLRAAPVPGSTLAEWNGRPDGSAELAVGVIWDVVRAELELGLEALDRLRLAGLAGPALCAVAERLVSVLVPVGTADSWSPAIAGVTTAGRGHPLRVPVPRVCHGPYHWLIPPDGSGYLTDPKRLRSALRHAQRVYATAVQAG
ncbi:hypothetical protein DN069_31920 [Streptacidiphilus pinicola]|uniref:DNA primase/polymerase bifunctional N-terminal domain-containing protein n=1 Tax=Streptacidiphilus pinicola TaxID=2219663 RepID=A0A2X0K2T2_9ACTN|nr:hypothetical protein [Streptacidiphilus pinicola]RAG81610.1 hypothetical protein DN069_31920 [Streptacidiphilus pinicola]